MQLNIINDPVSVFYRSGIFKRAATCKPELQVQSIITNPSRNLLVQIQQWKQTPG